MASGFSAKTSIFIFSGRQGLSPKSAAFTDGAEAVAWGQGEGGPGLAGAAAAPRAACSQPAAAPVQAAAAAANMRRSIVTPRSNAFMGESPGCFQRFLWGVIVVCRIGHVNQGGRRRSGVVRVP